MVNATDSVLYNIQFCEGKYGGLTRGLRPFGVHVPEQLNSWTGLFIAWCGVHMLLFNQHDDLTLKVIAAHFCLNGAASFLYHWTGYDSALAIDGFTMMNAVWLTTGFVLEELTSHMVDGPTPWDGLCHKGYAVRRCVRTLYWVFVTCIPALFLLLEGEPWSSYVSNIAPWFIGAFITPLVLMLAVNMLLMISAVEDTGFEFYPSPAYGARIFGAARSRFFWGLTLVLLGVGAWLLSEGLCDQYDAFKIFPGHALFHVLMALGLVNCLVYPATLRARTYRSHVRFLSDSPALAAPVPGDVPPPAPLGLLRELWRCIALAYLHIFPGMSFVRSGHLPLSSSSSTTTTTTTSGGGSSCGGAVAPKPPRTPAGGVAAPARTAATPVPTAEAQRIEALEARLAMLEQTTPQQLPAPQRPLNPLVQQSV